MDKQITTIDDLARMINEGFKTTAAAGAPGEMLALDLLGGLLPDFMGCQTQMPLIHASVIGVQSCDTERP